MPTQIATASIALLFTAVLTLGSYRFIDSRPSVLNPAIAVHGMRWQIASGCCWRVEASVGWHYPSIRSPSFGRRSWDSWRPPFTHKGPRWNHSTRWSFLATTKV